MTNRKGNYRREHEKDSAWQLLQQRKCHLEKGLSRSLPPAILRSLESLWEPVRTYTRMLLPLPTPLVEMWAKSPNGHLLFSSDPSTYIPEAVDLGKRRLVSVARVNIPQVVNREIDPLIATGRLLDHFLGSLCTPGGAWITEGASEVHPRLAEIGRELREIWELGYGPEWTQASPSDYFAWGFARFLQDRKDLNVVDPLLEKTLRHTIFSEQFWHSIREEIPG